MGGGGASATVKTASRGCVRGARHSGPATERSAADSALHGHTDQVPPPPGQCSRRCGPQGEKL